jgi:hypothetical protein
MRFLEAANRVGRSITLAIDGFNECPGKLKQSLIKDLQAFFLRWHVPIVVTTQHELRLPKALAGRSLQFCDPDKDERLAILKAYTDAPLPQNALELCSSFRSAYELSLAAACLSELGSHPTRARLFDAFVGRRCQDVVDVPLARRVLSEIADAMRTGLRSSLSVAQVWQIGERILGDQGVSLTKLQDIVSCGIVDVQQGQCRFSHELLQRFFEMLALMRTADRPEDLARELKKPAHHALIEFCLAMQTGQNGVARCLEAAVESGAGSELLQQCLYGHFGEVVRVKVTDDVRQLLRTAHHELDAIGIQLEPAKRQRDPFEVHIINVTKWSAYDRTLMAAIAKQLPGGLFLDEVLRLVGDTERRCVELLGQKYDPDTVAKRSFRSTLFWKLFVLGPSEGCLPAASIVRELNGHLISGTSSAVARRASQLFAKLDDLSFAELYVILSVLDEKAGAFEEQLPRLFRHCWNSGIYHLQLRVLDRVGAWGGWMWRDHGLREETRNELADILSGLQTSNIMLSTQLVETLMAFDLVESPVSSDDVAQQLRSILEHPDDAAEQQQAYIAVSNIFEEIFQDAYYRGIDSLSEKDRTRLFTMAGLAMPSDSFSATYILSQLLKQNDIDALPAFRRFAVELEGECCFVQERTGCFLLAHVGCARFLDAPEVLADLSNDDRRAWQRYGEIVFWLSKADVPTSRIREYCEPLWRVLETELAFEAIDPLSEFSRALGSTSMERGGDPIRTLRLTFQDELRRILGFGLKNRNHLSSIDRRISPEARAEDLTTFMIQEVGLVGNTDSIEVLKPFVDDKQHGRQAVEAIRRLNAGKSFT